MFLEDLIMVIFKVTNRAIKYASELESKCNDQETLRIKIYTYICVKKNKKKTNWTLNVKISPVNPISLLFSHHVKVWKLARSLVSESRAEYYQFSSKTMYLHPVNLSWKVYQNPIM